MSFEDGSKYSFKAINILFLMNTVNIVQDPKFSIFSKHFPRQNNLFRVLAQQTTKCVFHIANKIPNSGKNTSWWQHHRWLQLSICSIFIYMFAHMILAPHKRSKIDVVGRDAHVSVWVFTQVHATHVEQILFLPKHGSNSVTFEWQDIF